MVTRVGFWDGEIYYGDDEDYVPYEEYEELLAERDALKDDAERYRWVREQQKFQRLVSEWLEWPDQYAGYPDACDGAIDAVRGE